MPAVILCEKPALARDLAKALGGAIGKGNGWIDCQAARLTWAIGRLDETAPPEAYDPKFERWRMEDLPIIPQKWILKPRTGVEDQLAAAVETLRNADVVYIATDPGREGELIAYEIIERAGVNVPIKRLWFSALDEESLRRAWANPKEGSETVRLYHAAQTRQRADWLFAINLTRAATLTFSSGEGLLSYGRVQTPTLALIVARDREIEGFRARQYFEFNATLHSGSHSIQMRYAPTDDKDRLWVKENAVALMERLRGASGAIQVKREAKQQAPPRPYALSDLQGDANSRFAYSAQDTLDLAQALYEKHKAITYPRSDCTYLSEEMRSKVPNILRFLIEAQAVPNHPELANPILRKTVFDTAKLSDHHAIVPTPVRPPLENMTANERNVYGLIAARFALILMPDFEYEATTITLATEDASLIARGRVTHRKGWRDLHRATDDDEHESDETELPPIRDGSPGQVKAINLVIKVTQPPLRYTEKTLLVDMKSVQRVVEEPAIKQRLKETSGIGTEATRASHIETLKRRKCISLGGPGSR